MKQFRMELRCPNCGRFLRTTKSDPTGVVLEHPKTIKKCQNRVVFEGNGWWSVFSCPVLPVWDALQSHNSDRRGVI